MTLVCTAYGGPEEGPSPDALALPLTPEFLLALQARQRLLQRLSGTDGAGALDSVLFHESAPVWFSWAEALDDVLQAAEAQGWTLTPGGLPAEPGVRTDCEFLQVWPERFQFRCCLRNTDRTVTSAMLYFDDLFAAARQFLPAAEWRPAA